MWTLRRARAAPRFWFFLGVWLCPSISVLMILTHQVAHTLDRGFDRQAGLFALGLMALMSAIGRPFIGILTDYIRREPTVSISTLCSFVGILVLTLASADSAGYRLIVYAVFFGLGFGSRGAMRNVMLAERFGRPRLGAIYGAASGFGIGLASLIGPWLGGWMFDLAGAYASAFLIAGGRIILGGVCAWLAVLYPSRSAPPPTTKSLAL